MRKLVNGNIDLENTKVTNNTLNYTVFMHTYVHEQPKFPSFWAVHSYNNIIPDYINPLDTFAVSVCYFMQQCSYIALNVPRVRSER